jgi:hypothetical protein
LAFEGTAGSQEYILVIAVDVFSPIGEPGDGVVVSNGFPLARHVGDRNGHPFTNVEGDVFWTNTEL